MKLGGEGKEGVAVEIRYIVTTKCSSPPCSLTSEYWNKEA